MTLSSDRILGKVNILLDFWAWSCKQQRSSHCLNLEEKEVTLITVIPEEVTFVLLWREFPPGAKRINFVQWKVKKSKSVN